MVVAPLGGLPVLLIRMVHVEQREVVPCGAEQGVSMLLCMQQPALPLAKVNASIHPLCDTRCCAVEQGHVSRRQGAAQARCIAKHAAVPKAQGLWL